MRRDLGAQSAPLCAYLNCLKTDPDWGLVFFVFLSLAFALPGPASGLVNPPSEELKITEHWTGIYARGQRIGFSYSLTSRTNRGYTIREKTIISLKYRGTTSPLRTDLLLRTDSRFKMRSFWIELTSEPSKLEIQGNLRGQSLHLKIHSAAKMREHQIQVDETPWLTTNLRYFLCRNPLKVGHEWTVLLFDPLTLTCEPMEISVKEERIQNIDGKPVPAFRLLYCWNGLKSHAWVTGRGEILRQDGLGGLSFLRETRNETIQDLTSNETLDLADHCAIPVDKSIPSPRDLRYLRLRFSDRLAHDYAFRDQRQRSTNEEIEVRREDLTDLPSQTTTALSPDLPQKTLTSTPFVQSDDPQIRQLAERIVDGAEDRLGCVRKMTRWVYRHIKKTPVFSVPSAVEILRTRQGDCNEHAVLTAALCRAVGIPTKICAGVIYEGGYLRYHAWNEVYVGKWIAVDSIFGQTPADATHVKFVEGTMSSQVKLMPLLGRLQAEILAYE